ncbi:MAG TPA: DciA family protein [Stellaceae bacterium]|nr:DciA family protein [Stellaceae bacterium]
MDTDRRGDSIAAATAAGERRPGLRPIAGAAVRVAGPIVARRGGGLLGRLQTDWRAVAGDELAAESWPAALSRGGVLKLRVAPRVALELQHRTPLLIERINLFFGRGVAERIVLVQGPLPLAAAPPPSRPDSPSAAEQQALDDSLVNIADPELREALRRLGRLVLGRGGR